MIDTGCHRIRSGLGDRAACATHSVPWPCQVRALSLTRPWTELVVAGIKPVENRSWAAPHLGWIVIHAAKSWDAAALSVLTELGQDGMLTPDEYAKVDGCVLHTDAPTGYLGVARIVGCHMARDLLCGEHNPDPDGMCSPWAFEGSYHWELTDAARFPEPLHGPGALGLFTPPETPLGRLRDLMWEAGARD